MYYIHIDDPSFAGADSDFPFGRRLGPFLTKGEAVAQAVSDIAGGLGESYTGVFTETESEKMRHGGDGSTSVSRDDLEPLAEKERQKRQEAAAVVSDPSVSAQWDVVEAAAKGNEELLGVIRELKGRTM